MELHTDSSSMIASVLKDRSEDFMSGPTGLLADQVTALGCYQALDLRKTKAHRGHAEAIAQGDAANWLGNHRADQEADYAVADYLPLKAETDMFQQRRTAAHSYLAVALEALEKYDEHLKVPHNARSAAKAASRKPVRRPMFFPADSGVWTCLECLLTTYRDPYARK